MLDHAVPIYKNSHSMKITFTRSRYSSNSLRESPKKMGLDKGAGAKAVGKQPP
jgi:hypothetical protein